LHVESLSALPFHNKGQVKTWLLDRFQLFRSRLFGSSAALMGQICPSSKGRSSDEWTAQLMKELNISDESNHQSILMACLNGWMLMQQGDVLECDECFRKIGLWQTSIDFIEDHRSFCPYRYSDRHSRSPLIFLPGDSDKNLSPISLQPKVGPESTSENHVSFWMQESPLFSRLLSNTFVDFEHVLVCFVS
jgi:hypothetical protein